MSAGKIHIAQVGVKNHGRTMLEATCAAGNLELVAVFDVDDAAAREAAVASGARLSGSFEDILADPAVEAVSLVTPNDLHAEEVRKAASAGKHIFVEKPMAATLADARSMMDLAGDAGVVLMVGHNTRRRRVFRRAKQILSAGRIGTIVAAEMNLSRPAGLQPGLPGWKADPRKCPLLPMTQLGIHFVDTIEYLIAPVERVSCIAATRAMAHGVSDTALALLELLPGIPVALSSSYVTPDVYSVRIYGTGGILRCGSLSLTLEIAKNGEIVDVIHESFDGEGAESYILEMREFGECILTGKRPETGGPEGLRSVAVLEAMVKSVESGTIIELSHILPPE
jgi:UDP-N-acetylglucosamine 3-dehydrogenase